MQQAPSYMAPGSELELASQQTQRQRMLADMLRKQSTDPMQGQMAGQMYVPPSWTQGLAKLLQGYVARKHDDAADANMQQARSAYDGRNRASTQELVAALSGTPAEQAPQDTAQFGADMSTPEQPPDMNKALAVALGNQENPMMAAFGGKILESKLGSMIPKAPEWVLGERFNEKTGMPEKFMYNKNNPAQEMAVGGQQARKLEFVNGQGVDPYQGTPQGQAIPKQPDAPNPRTELLVDDGTGKLVPNAPLIDAKKQIAGAGASKITNTLSTAGPAAFEKKIADLDATRLDEWRTQAESASSTLETVNSLRDAEAKGAYSGGGAGAKLAAAKIINGFTGVEPKNMVGSELYNAEASKLVLDKIKMLGANPSNADRDFIEKTVPQLSNSSTARKEMANFLEKKARTAIDRFKRADDYARKNYGLKGFDMFPSDGKAAGWSITPVN